MGKHLIKQGKRKCWWCKSIFPLSKKFFCAHRAMPAGLNYLCYKCANEQCKEWYKKHPEKKRHQSGRYLHLKKIVEKKIRRKLKSKEVIHHIDGNERNNRSENLFIFCSQSAHYNYEQNLRTTYVKWIRAEINKTI